MANIIIAEKFCLYYQQFYRCNNMCSGILSRDFSTFHLRLNNLFWTIIHLNRYHKKFTSKHFPMRLSLFLPLFYSSWLRVRNSWIKKFNTNYDWRHRIYFLVSTGFESKVYLDGLSNIQNNIICFSFSQALQEAKFSHINKGSLVQRIVEVTIIYVSQFFRLNNRKDPWLDDYGKTCFLPQEQ